MGVKREFRIHPTDPNSLTLLLHQQGEQAVIEVLLARHPVGSVTLEATEGRVKATIASAEPTIDATTRLMRAPTSDELHLRYITLIDRLKALDLDDATAQRVIDHPSAQALYGTLGERELEPKDAKRLREFEKLVEATEAFAAYTSPEHTPGA